MANHPDNSNITVRERVFALMRHFGATRLYQALGDSPVGCDATITMRCSKCEQTCLRTLDRFYGRETMRDDVARISKSPLQWLHPFFLELFACENDPESAPITSDNLTEAETQIIKVYFANFLFNFMRSDFTHLKFLEREFLSGLVSFRIDLFPVRMPICYPDDPDEDPEDVCAEHEFLFPFLFHMNKWEKHFKNQIINGYSKGNFKEINPQYARLVTAEVREIHKWWNEDYGEFDDLIRVDNDQNLLGEYLPNSEPIPFILLASDDEDDA